MLKMKLAKPIAGRPEMSEGVTLCSDPQMCNGETVVFADEEFIRQKKGTTFDGSRRKTFRPTRKVVGKQPETLSEDA